MNVSKINNNVNFRAKLCGDIATVIRLSKEGGLPESLEKVLIRQIHQIVPKNKDRVFFIFRKPFQQDYWHDFKIRSQIEVLEEGDVFNSQNLRANVYPFKSEQRDLLIDFVSTLEKLMQKEIKPEETRLFYPEKNFSWIKKYEYGDQLKTGFVNFDEGLAK